MARNKAKATDTNETAEAAAKAAAEKEAAERKAAEEAAAKAAAEEAARKAAAEAERGKVQVTALQTIRCDGKTYKAGAKVKVDPAHADQLRAAKAAE